MQPEGREIQVLHLLRGIEQRQYLLYLAHMFGAHAFGIVVFEKLPQSFVAETFDHEPSTRSTSKYVKYEFTYVKWCFTYDRE